MILSFAININFSGEYCSCCCYIYTKNW